MPKTEKWLTSRHNVVRCPHCMNPNDFRELAFEATLGQYENGMVVQCGDGPESKNRGCDKYMEIVKVEPTTLISVRKTNRPGNIPVGAGS